MRFGEGGARLSHQPERLVEAQHDGGCRLGTVSLQASPLLASSLLASTRDLAEALLEGRARQPVEITDALQAETAQQVRRAREEAQGLDGEGAEG